MSKNYPAQNKFCVILLLAIITASSASAQFGTGGFGFQRRSERRAEQAYHDGRAAGKQMRGYLGYDVGVFFSFADRNFSYSYYDIDANGNNQGEKVYTKKLKPRILGFHAGSYIPLSSLGRTSCLAFDWGVEATILKDNTGKFVVTTPLVTSRYETDLIYMQFAIPLCLDFKYGGEAIYDKAEAFSVTLGAGLQPSLGSGGMLSTGKIKGAISPMIKAEIGFFAGFQWKVRAAYVAQPGVMYKAQNGDAGMEGRAEGSVISLTSKPSFNIGISFMPFSYDWDSSRW